MTAAAGYQSLFLQKMLERLYASLASGPSLNCRPQNSRQRVDFSQLKKLEGPGLEQALAMLLGAERKVKLTAPLAALAVDESSTESPSTAEVDKRTRSAIEQQALIRKLGVIAEDALELEHETGAQALHIGFPLLHVSGAGARGRFGNGRRVLAPIAFIPVRLTVKKGKGASVMLESVGEGADRVIPNPGLLAWLERETGKIAADLFVDLEGEDPWRELNELTVLTAQRLELPAPETLGPESTLIGPAAPAAPAAIEESAQGGAIEIIPAAVLGLYPLSNQNLIHDVRALLEGEPVVGPVESFLKVELGFSNAEVSDVSARAVGQSSESAADFASERLVTQADPCQAHAVRTARTAGGLVVHGPPGTGKSQTITNIIGDHLARGERVLFVCDKRTAIDVVKYRLDAIGLGQLCAVVHDPQRDQRDLYLAVRDQLEALTEQKTSPGCEAELAKLDNELARIRQKLGEHDNALCCSPAGTTAPSFHDLTGAWLSIDVPAALLRLADGAREVDLELLNDQAVTVQEVLDRGTRAAFPDNPWRDALGVTLKDWLALPGAEARARLEKLVQLARAADATNSADIPAFSERIDVRVQGEARAAFARDLSAASRAGHGAELARWAACDDSEVAAARRELEALATPLEQLRSRPLDPELLAVTRLAPTSLPEQLIARAKLELYLAIATRWWGIFFFLRRSRAASVLARYGLAVSAAAAQRVYAFLDGIRARTLVAELEKRLTSTNGANVVVDPLDETRLKAVTLAQETAFALLARLSEPALEPGASWLRERLRDSNQHESAALVLAQSQARAEAIAAFMQAAQSSELFTSPWLASQHKRLVAGGGVSTLGSELAARLTSVESLLRIRAALATCPPALAAALDNLLAAGAAKDAGYAALRKAALGGELTRRFASSPVLQELDGDSLAGLHDRLDQLRTRKIAVVRELVLHQWTDRQRSRLLAANGGRLNALGADLKRRLFVRGNKVLRVRQLIAAGQSTEGGDPLFDLRPVWMASPETVAQVFPRKPLFDVVIFDESSQCKLEEAIPVLTRAKRVVIAGDRQQLPPTRFFESTVAESEAPEAEGEQEFFEQRQAEVEDLLTAALNLEIEQSYLDVHYRSQNSDLIGFSNDTFYASRLQAIPAHPANRVRMPPIKLIPANGTYLKRTNKPEARAVVEIVRELLTRPQPPSIGVACFNLAQRDEILDALDAAAADDRGFGEMLALAKQRRGTGSFEGLFVKNLENVQGDERDHIIISTTYGPDEKGRFYRRFGPLGMPGGGRRLNVLITRARQQVHVVTSIPRAIYMSRPAIAPGAAPSGGWLLFAYLEFAERLEATYAAAELAKPLAARPDLENVTVNASEAPSLFAEAFAQKLHAEDDHSSVVHWGNDGFCVDIALRHPTNSEDVTVGLLCDNTRFGKAPDRITWDLFRAAVLRQQGWKLLRLWTPEFFRDPERVRERVSQEIAEVLVKAAPPEETKALLH